MTALEDKLKQASGAAKRIADALMASADSIIAREAELAKRTQEVAQLHLGALDSQGKQLDKLEDALKLLSNDPLAPSSNGGAAPS